MLKKQAKYRFHLELVPEIEKKVKQTHRARTHRRGKMANLDYKYCPQKKEKRPTLHLLKLSKSQRSIPKRLLHISCL